MEKMWDQSRVLPWLLFFWGHRMLVSTGTDAGNTVNMESFLMLFMHTKKLVAEWQLGATNTYLDMNRLFFCHVHQFSATDMAVAPLHASCVPLPWAQWPGCREGEGPRGYILLCSQESPTNPAKITPSPGWNSCLSVNTANAKLHTQNFISIDFYLCTLFFIYFLFWPSVYSTVQQQYPRLQHNTSKNSDNSERNYPL